jgi:hypothetical protein
MTDGKRRFSVWDSITTATPKHMQLSLQQGRTGIRDYCRQHKLAFDFFNDTNAFGATLKPFGYDFGPDLEEMDFPTDYPEDKPQ